MDCLPSELLVQIVSELDDNSQLTNMRLASREWYRALNRDGKILIHANRCSFDRFGSIQPSSGFRNIEIKQTNRHPFDNLELLALLLYIFNAAKSDPELINKCYLYYLQNFGAYSARRYMVHADNSY